MMGIQKYFDASDSLSVLSGILSTMYKTLRILFSRGLSKHAHPGLNFHNTYFARFLAYKIIWVQVPSAYYCHGRSFGILYPYLDDAVWETSP